jgi:mono/diheme cytochrome c family protein
LIVLTIALAVVFLVRSSITVGATGKILAFVGLCVLPVLCIGAGWSVQQERSEQTSACTACHSMESHGKSLYVADPSYIPAQHFQNHLVPADKACYTCHTDYARYGSFEDKLRGLKYIYMQYVSTPPKTIRISSPYSNLQCLHCHAGARGFSDNPAHNAIMGSLTTNQISCLTCHDTIHNASEVGHLKMWVPGNAQTSFASASSSSAPGPAKAESGVTNGPLKASAAGGATTAATQGKSIFASQGCGGCHGESGGGGSGPALTHVSSQYPPAKLTAVLKAPTAKMKAGGMVALTVNAADMTALVSYVTSLGGTSAASAATPPSAGSSSPAPAKAAPPKTAVPSKAPAGDSASNATAAQGKSIFDSQGCNGCHGESGVGGSGPALTHTSSQYPPSQLTAVLKAPTAQMKAAGMVPLSINAADMEALVSYVSSLGGTSVASAAPPASGSSSPATAKAAPAATAVPSKDATAAAPPVSVSSSPAAAKAEPAATAASSKAPTGGSNEAATIATQGKGVYDSHGCGGCHGESGGGSSGPALTDISSQYPPAKLPAVLQAPTDKMKAAGMVALSVNAADMKALVSYVASLGGTSAASVTTSPASAASSTAPAKAELAATAGLPKTESKGQAIFKAHGCADCHGTNGIGGTAAASALAGTGKSFAPALLTTELQHPTAQMLRGGMPPVSLSGDELKALVAYVSSISGAKGNPQ